MSDDTLPRFPRSAVDRLADPNEATGPNGPYLMVLETCSGERLVTWDADWAAPSFRSLSVAWRLTVWGEREETTGVDGGADGVDSLARCARIVAAALYAAGQRE